MSTSARPPSSTGENAGGEAAEEKPATGATGSADRDGKGTSADRGADRKPVDTRTTNFRSSDFGIPDAKPDGNRAADPRATDPRAADPRATDPRATDPRAAEARATDPRAAEVRAAEDDGFEDTRTALVRAKPRAPLPAATDRNTPAVPPVKHEPKPHEARSHETRPQETRPEARPHPVAGRSQGPGQSQGPGRGQGQGPGPRPGADPPHGDIGDTLTLVIKPVPAPSASQAAQDAKAALNSIIAAAEARSPLAPPEPEPQPELDLPDGKRRGGRHRRRANRWRTFFFILWRDIFVTGREIGPFLGQVIVEPFFMLFVFGKVLGEIGMTQPGFQQVLLPGVVALNSFLVSLQNTALPLAIDFSWTKEIEDRLLSPLPTGMVAVEKALFGAIRGVIGALVMIPIGLLLLDGVSWPLSKMPETLGILSLGGLVGGAVGLTLGTLAPARHISIVFAMTLTPIMFTGATQFPWRSLDGVRWFQILCTFNPLTYVTEAMRGLLLPDAPGVPPSIPLWICACAIAASLLVFGFIGIRGFNRRAQD
uniref:Putative membrane protein n=1 Tax=Streptomyces sp. RK95-74 TaxID=1934390 RepID=A0A1L7P0B3_9ACTN|nr:putative ABC-2 type transporter [Streptomyces sp. RK95-74]